MRPAPTANFVCYVTDLEPSTRAELGQLGCCAAMTLTAESVFDFICPVKQDPNHPVKSIDQLVGNISDIRGARDILSSYAFSTS